MRSLVQVQDGPLLVMGMGSAGGLAQLVERLLCKQDVSGSSPLTSMRTSMVHCVDFRRRVKGTGGI